MTGSKREMQKVSSGPLQDWMDGHELTPKMAGDALGVSHGAISKYLRTGFMPKMTIMAIEGIKRREGAPTVFAVHVATDKIAAVMSMINAMNLPYVKLDFTYHKAGRE